MAERSYCLFIEGCQMNYSDVRPVIAHLERLGYRMTPRPEEADVVLLETCTVRQSAEDKAYSWLQQLKPLKARRPEMVVALMGCLVGVKGNRALQQRFPYVDVLLPPSDGSRLIEYLRQREIGAEEYAATEQRYALQDAAWPDAASPDAAWDAALAGAPLLPAHQRGTLVVAPVAVVYGCSHACSFCIIPGRRGVERSRPIGAIVAEVRALAEQGVREVQLLGQIVDRYGYDVPAGPDLADLLQAVDAVDGIERIRFLTSHPNYMNDRLLDTVAALPKVCEHIEVPVQAGDDEVLARMKRGYRADDYRRLVASIRERVPGVAIATDIIVGFPGESDAQFRATYDLLGELRLDVAHIAKYSPRPGTLSARKYPDDVLPAEKERRRRALDEQQARILAEINAATLGQSLLVLVEGDHKGRWRGRTRTNKLVFFEDPSRDWRGQIAEVTIDWAGPWSLLGRLPGRPALPAGVQAGAASEWPAEVISLTASG
jgi:tRNA-2-methylthio-N6-dimethylallyladenosine synthase